MDRLREVAKFVCGFEAFHTVFHGYLWLTGTTMTVLGITLTPSMNMLGAILNGAISVILGIYAWRSRGR
mgnify:CR=1 FL=1